MNQEFINYSMPMFKLLVGLAIFYIIFVILWIVSWIITLIHQSKRNRWVWFVLTLIFPVVLVIYWIVWLSSKKFRRKKK